MEWRYFFRENAHLSLLKKKEKCILKASRHRTEDPSKKKHLQAKMIKRNENYVEKVQWAKGRKKNTIFVNIFFEWKKKSGKLRKKIPKNVDFC